MQNNAICDFGRAVIIQSLDYSHPQLLLSEAFQSLRGLFMKCYAEALVLLLKRANAMFSVLVLFKLNITSLPMSASGMNPHATPKIDRNLIISAFLIVLAP